MKAGKLSHADLLQLLGEVDGISLQSEVDRHGGDYSLVVYLEIDDKRVELIRADCSLTGRETIDHRVTRIVMAMCLEQWPDTSAIES